MERSHFKDSGCYDSESEIATAPISLKLRLRGIAEKSVQRRYHLCALADGAADPLDRPRADVSNREHARHRGLQRRHQPSLISVRLRAGHDETGAIKRDAATIEPAGGGIRASEQEEIADLLGGALFAG